MAEAKYDDDPELYKVNNADPDCESKPWDEEKKIIYGIFKCFSGITSLFKDEQYQALQGKLSLSRISIYAFKGVAMLQFSRLLHDACKARLILNGGLFINIPGDY